MTTRALRSGPEMTPAGIPELQNRTLICSVLFIDIVEYSRKPVVEQSRLKDRLNALLSEALRGVAVNDRIILDTGDGAAISFIGDPEDALFVATALRDVMESSADGEHSPLSTRMGINLGPVRLVKDINGQPNIIGDGINVAQRVMTFARPGQVLVSRSYYEVVSRLSEESAKLFSYEGARTDKHIREHEVYAVGSVSQARRRSERSITEGTAETSAPDGARATSGTLERCGALLRRPAAATVLAVIAIVGIAFASRAVREPAETGRESAQSVTAKRQAEVAAMESKLPPIRGMPPEPAQLRLRPSTEAAAQAGIPSAEQGTREVAAADAPAKKTAKEKKPREKPPAPEGAAREPQRTAEAAVSSAPALLSVAVSPWGEVHVDGKLHGVSPPLQELELAPGRHRIEIRNTASQPHIVTVNAKAGERIRIKHKFE